jgi:cytosine/adenosine deaminase-related metal-dependent hydrolase
MTDTRRTLIKDCMAIATMDDAGTEYRGESILLRGQTIEAVGPAVADALALDDHVDETIDGQNVVVLPGFVNTHHHLFQTLTRAVPVAQDEGLFNWLLANYEIWAGMDPDCVHTSAQVGLGELLLTGCTTSSDHFYLFPKGSPDDLLDWTIRAASTLGIRFHPTRGSMSRGRSAGGLPPDDCVQSEDAILKDCERVIAAHHDPEPLSMCRVGLAPCSPFSVTDDLMRRSAELARAHGLRLHTHLAETEDEETYCLEHYGRRPLAHMESLGWLGDDVWYAHGIHFNDEELQLLGTMKTGIAHCPTSNMRLGSGTCRIPGLLAAGVPIGLGVDGSASNDSSDMLAEVRNTMLVHRMQSGVKAMTARQALRLATRGGAEVLGRDDIGQLAAGKAADVVLYDVMRLEYAGALHDPIAALLFCGTGGRVQTAFVNGRKRVNNGRLLAVDENELSRNANRLAQALAERAQVRTQSEAAE